MADVSIAQHYHQRTKYDPETIHAKSGGLDWSQQPLPYKDYKLGHEVDLKPYLEDEPTNADDTWRWWQRLSRLLIDSYGLTARVTTFAGEALYLRSAPSAGGLYPAEIYLVSRGTSRLTAGLYNYQVRTHSLVRFWDDHPWQDLQAACFWHPALETTQMALVVSTVFQRSAWRYQDRAYRRVFLDSGHLLGNLEVAGTLCDYRPHLIGGFADEQVNQLLYLDGVEESAIALLALADLFEVDQNLPLSQSALPSPLHSAAKNIPDGELLQYLHQNSLISKTSGFGQRQQQRKDSRLDKATDGATTEAQTSAAPGSLGASEATSTQADETTRDTLPPDNRDQESPKAAETAAENAAESAAENLARQSPQPAADKPANDKPAADKYNFPFGITVSTTTQPIGWGDHLKDLENTLLTRRSTRRYTGAPLHRADLFALLDFSYHPEHYRLQAFDQHPDYFDLGLIETFIAVSNVEALESGCYYYAPQAQELRQIRFNRFQKDLHFLCLGQELGRDAGAVIFHTANLEAAVAKYGERAYRYLHMDAGHLGQRLNLAATRRNLGVSGIAGFFDDQVNELLSIPAEEAVLYVTTVGQKAVC
ncbi:MAG: SagB/ThcOx family dehydrogenase [Cyanobacteria bacterium P01_A01_bin.116]